MIVPDINLLLYAYDVGASRHGSALRWWDGLVFGTEHVGIPWAVATGFVRLMSNPRVVTSAIAASEAADYVNDWFSYAHIAPLNPGAGHIAHFRQALAVPGSGPNLVPDAHIAALALEFDAEVHSNDSDFSRFPGVRWRNPLA